MSFDTTPGGSAATSYPTLEFAKDYFNYRLHSDLWISFSDKKAALITGTRLLDRWVKWYGAKSFEVQSLDWPRTGVVDKDGYIIPDIEIPTRLMEATCELAYAMLREDLTATNDMKGIKSVKIGSLAVEADKFDRASTIPEAVWKAIGGLGKAPLSGQVRLVRC